MGQIFLLGLGHRIFPFFLSNKNFRRKYFGGLEIWKFGGNILVDLNFFGVYSYTTALFLGQILPSYPLCFYASKLTYTVHFVYVFVSSKLSDEKIG